MPRWVQNERLMHQNCVPTVSAYCTAAVSYWDERSHDGRSNKRIKQQNYFEKLETASTATTTLGTLHGNLFNNIYSKALGNLQSGIRYGVMRLMLHSEELLINVSMVAMILKR
jgi:hypothetical protein